MAYNRGGRGGGGRSISSGRGGSQRGGRGGQGQAGSGSSRGQARGVNKAGSAGRGGKGGGRNTPRGGRGGGRRGGRGQRSKPLSKDDLDNDLASYMLKDKNHGAKTLDDDLDTYFAAKGKQEAAPEPEGAEAAAAGGATA